MKSLRFASKLSGRSSLRQSRNVAFKLNPEYKLHIPDTFEGEMEGPRDEIDIPEAELKDMYLLMNRIRHFETECDKAYKMRKIRGFLHLYSGQEAVVTGLEHAADFNDGNITAYRCHGHQLARGGSSKEAMAELFGKGTGCARGKGGSMHFYHAENNFFGGNGIVGAQIPVGTGLAFASKYLAEIKGEKNKNCSWIYFGDGASNQGQAFEAYNMASLWKIPSIYVVEDNRYGMGTSASRSSASIDYYKRGDYVPGIRFNGMDVLEVAEVGRYSKEFALEHGPLMLQAQTYRYYGHSMSDPGKSYRTRDEVKDVRKTTDPIMLFKNRLIEENVFTKEELKELEQMAKKEAAEAVQFAEESPYPSNDQFISDVFCDGVENEVRGRHMYEIYQAPAKN